MDYSLGDTGIKSLVRIPLFGPEKSRAKISMTAGNS